MNVPESVLLAVHFTLVISLFVLAVFVQIRIPSFNQFPAADSSHECRFWAMTAPTLPITAVTTHLINGSSSLKSLGSANPDGWGLAYYSGVEPLVQRGLLPADLDPLFDQAATELAESGSRVGVGHVRRASSGATDIPNPHPFVRFKGGRWWTYGHNGGLYKPALKELIGQEYLEQNPPTFGDNWSDPRAIDSDLYMLYILKCVEENDWNVTLGIARAVDDITRSTWGTMNFFLTDGQTLWGFRLGNTLYYYESQSSPYYSVIASQPPESDTTGWVALSDNNLIVLAPDCPSIIIDNVTTVPELSVPAVLSLLMLLPVLLAILHRENL